MLALSFVATALGALAFGIPSAVMFVAVVLFLLFNRTLPNRYVSALATVVWTILPSSIATHEFLSTRSYMEGLGLSCAAMLIALKIAEGTLRENVASLALRLNKPLSARLFPVPGKRTGERTEFTSPYLTNTVVR